MKKARIALAVILAVGVVGGVSAFKSHSYTLGKTYYIGPENASPTATLVKQVTVAPPAGTNTWYTTIATGTCTNNANIETNE